MFAVRQLQQQIWGLTEPEMGLYPPVLNTAAKNGGVVLGAFDDESGQMVGFLFSFLGREPGGPLKLCSQTMGVLPDWRGLGIAGALKHIQRERALEQGLKLITWTFDPLEAPNAHLNLHKLRAISRVYWRDVYGATLGQLNAGLPTDRLLVEWWIQGARVAGRPAAPITAGRPIFQVESWGAIRHIVETHLDLSDGVLLLEVPADIHAVKATSLELALEWRLQVREAFEHYLAGDFVVTGFVSGFEGGGRCTRYVLQQRTTVLAEEIGLA